MMEPTPPATVADEPKVRDRLLAAATRLFAERGYAATSVNEIVAAAGVTKPILYYYFKNKEGLYLEILTEAYRVWADLIHEAAQWPGTAWERILRLASRQYDLFVANLHTARMIYGIVYGPSQGTPVFDFMTHMDIYHQTILKFMEEGIAAGEFKAGDAQDMTLGIAGLIWMTLDQELCQHLPFPLGYDGMIRILNLYNEGLRR